MSRARLRGRRSKDKRLDLVLHTGKKREIRRLFAALGYPVAQILRYGYGPLRLGTLETGAARPLSSHELNALKQAVNLGRP